MAKTTINSLVISALRHAEKFTADVAELRTMLSPEVLGDRALCADALRAGVAARHGIKLNVQGTGRAVFPADHASSEAARQDLSRLVKSVMGKGNGQKTEKARRVDAELLAKVQNLISRAGLTKAEARDLFNAVVEAAY